ncbi:peptide-methionine (R)-S-oxide reductase [Balamuthia mandrillaris]
MRRSKTSTRSLERADYTPMEMELLSSQNTQKNYKTLQEEGTYCCAHCGLRLFNSADKFVANKGGPTSSFRSTFSEGCVTTGVDYSFGLPSISLNCAGCGLYLGSLYKDGKQTGDDHPAAGQRYSIVSAAVEFENSANAAIAPDEVCVVAAPVQTEEEEEPEVPTYASSSSAASSHMADPSGLDILTEKQSHHQQQHTEQSLKSTHKAPTKSGSGGNLVKYAHLVLLAAPLCLALYNKYQKGSH